jgi:hypothetical protein
MAKKAESFRLSEPARTKLAALAKVYDNKTMVIELAIDRMHRGENGMIITKVQTQNATAQVRTSSTMLVEIDDENRRAYVTLIDADGRCDQWRVYDGDAYHRFVAWWRNEYDPFTQY